MAASWSVTRVFYLKHNIKLFKGKKTAHTLGVLKRSYSTSEGDRTEDAVSSKKGVVTYDIKTEPGQKKDTNCELPSAYSPHYVEAAWYEWWLQSGFFYPNVSQTEGQENKQTEGQENKQTEGQRNKPFVMCLPPPNVTGNLHLGHALTVSLQDAIIRWHRMKGETTLWIPGIDHAGISTQVVVEKKLWREQKLSRHEIGREKFVEETWKWKNKKGEIIMDQMKKMGSSLDWNRARFTMDQPMNKAVTEAFVRLHEAGLIYRSNRLVNWCCHLKSSISDIEVENREVKGRSLLDVPGYSKPVEFGILHSFAYPIEGSDETITVTTSRLETMLGDSAVCVHPDDKRYSHLHGRVLRHPFEERRLPVVVDSFVDPLFGSGAVKLTPAHDHTDYEVAQRHQLPLVDILDDSGRLTNVSQGFQGMLRFDARQAIKEALEERGLYRGEQVYDMVLPICSRSGDVIEPRLKEQWFVKCDEMAKEAIEAVRSGRLEIVPAMYQSEWFHWLENIRDWCISRQLWWGHQIPAYLAQRESSGHGSGIWVSGRTAEEAQTKAAKEFGVSPQQVTLEQDEDVLDTWFSSALFPFAVSGWPDQTADLGRFYPTSVLETGQDILFFWVARMVMLGQALTGQLPFTQVLLHGLLRDAHGRKMSKSLGNVIDPLDVIHGVSLQKLQNQLSESNLPQAEIEKAKVGQRSEFPEGIPECGTDALRFTLCSYNFKAKEINMDITHVKSHRHFCNKIWQAFRFVSSNLGEGFQPDNYQISQSSPFDQWIVSRLSHMVLSCDENFRSHDLHLVTKSLYHFWYMEFCNVYLEGIKPILWNDDSPHRDAVRQTLWLCVDCALRATGPFMPFLTEELYQRFPKKEEDFVSIGVTSYPMPEEYTWQNAGVEADMETVQLIANRALAVKKDFNLGKLRPNCFVEVSNAETQQRLMKYTDVISTLCRCGNTQVVESTKAIPIGCVPIFVNQDCKLHVQLKDILDPAREEERLEKRLNKVNSALEKLIAITEKKGYTRKNSLANQQRDQEKIGSFKREMDHIRSVLDTIQKLR